MRPPSPATLRPLLFALVGMAFATWLAVFFTDARRPTTPQERADRLAAENLLAGSLTADTPPSPEHWAQLEVWQDPWTGVRYPLARQVSAGFLAISGLQPRIAGVLAFGFATGALGWLLLGRARLGIGQASVLAMIASLTVAHGRAWQMSDPQPYVVLGAAALALGAWFRPASRAQTLRDGLAPGLGLALMFLCETALGFIAALAFLVAELWPSRTPESGANRSAGRARYWLGVAVPLFALLLAFVARNGALTGSILVSPEADYRERFTSAPRWFWEPVRAPQPDLDPVFERHDELVGMSSARLESPVLRVWLHRLTEAAERSAGLPVFFAALVVFALFTDRITRGCALMAAGLGVAALLHYPFSSSWWSFLAPPLLLGVARWLASMNEAHGSLTASGRVLATLAVAQAALLTLASQAKPTPAEYAFATRRDDVLKKIRETPGRHLVFVALEPGVDGRVEPAALPRDWASEDLLLARDLAPEENAKLAAAMPDRTAWRMVVFPERIGLQPWTAKADGS